MAFIKKFPRLSRSSAKYSLRDERVSSSKTYYTKTGSLPLVASRRTRIVRLRLLLTSYATLVCHLVYHYNRTIKLTLKWCKI